MPQRSGNGCAPKRSGCRRHWRNQAPAPTSNRPERRGRRTVGPRSATARGLLFDAQKGFAFAAGCTQAKEIALAHWLVNGADGGRCPDGAGTVRENAASDVLASLTTVVWNAPARS